MLQWEVRNKPGDDFPARVIEADAIILDEKRTAVIFLNESTGNPDAIIAMTPGMTITKKR
jgi:hypothetical protein